MKTFLMACLGLAGLGLAATSAMAEQGEVGIRGNLFEFKVQTEEGEVTVKRNQDTKATIQGTFAMTSRKCPPFCIQPMNAIEGVKTVGEIEVIDVMRDKDAILMDARTQEWHADETIPSSVNIPYTEVASRLDELGCKKASGKWNCAGAKKVALYCNGPWCGQSPAAIKAMVREGYPKDKILYYRGGMQLWKLLGLTTVEGSL